MPEQFLNIEWEPYFVVFAKECWFCRKAIILNGGWKGEGSHGHGTIFAHCKCKAKVDDETQRIVSKALRKAGW